MRKVFDEAWHAPSKIQKSLFLFLHNTNNIYFLHGCCQKMYVQPWYSNVYNPFWQITYRIVVSDEKYLIPLTKKSNTIDPLYISAWRFLVTDGCSTFRFRIKSGSCR